MEIYGIRVQLHSKQCSSGRTPKYSTLKYVWVGQRTGKAPPRSELSEEKTLGFEQNQALPLRSLRKIIKITIKNKGNETENKACLSQMAAKF
jgi:hypothetical protein